MMGMGGWTKGWWSREGADQVSAASADKPDLESAALHPNPICAGCLLKQSIFRSPVWACCVRLGHKVWGLLGSKHCPAVASILALGLHVRLVSSTEGVFLLFGEVKS